MSKTGRERVNNFRVACAASARLTYDWAKSEGESAVDEMAAAIAADLDTLARIREAAGPVSKMLDSPYTCNVSNKLRDDLSALLRAIGGET